MVPQRRYDRAMDITPQLIRETTFHESLRGYNKEEVEDYKQRWAEAVAQLQGRLMEAIERAERAEARALAAAGRSESEDVLRRNRRIELKLTNR